MDKLPFLLIVYLPPVDRNEPQKRAEFMQKLLGRLTTATGSAPVAVVKHLDVMTLLVEGKIGDISGVLHHVSDNETKYLVVQPQLPIAGFGVNVAEQWIRARQQHPGS